MPALLDLVRKLIDYGRELAAALHQRAAENAYFSVFNYGTNDLAVVVARITRGLLRAEALESRLVRLAARPEPHHSPAKATSPFKQSSHPGIRHAPDTDSLLAHLPTAEEIAAEDRRRPIGAVIADICRDLGILPCHPLWRQIQNAINGHGGSCVRLLKHVTNRNIQLAAEIVVPPPSSAPVCTGPP